MDQCVGPLSEPGAVAVLNAGRHKARATLNHPKQILKLPARSKAPSKLKREMKREMKRESGGNSIEIAQPRRARSEGNRRS